MFEQVLVESGRFYGQNKKMKLCLLMLAVDVKKAAAIIFEKKIFSHNRNEDFTNFTTEGFKDKFIQKQNLFKQLVALYLTMKLLWAVINTHGVIIMIAT